MSVWTWLRAFARELRTHRADPRQKEFVAQLLTAPGMPASVRAFYPRALGLATAQEHDWALDAATAPPDVGELLTLARGRRRIVELGTGPGWTTIALALAEPACRVTSFDPVVHDHRDAYLGLVGPEVRERITFVAAPGAQGAAGHEPVDLLFIDSTHDREATVAEFEAWRPRLASGAIVSFHDYGHPGFPGVAQAVAELGLEGERRGGMFVWRAP